MGGLYSLSKIQGGVESSLGSEVDATAIWRFTGFLKDLQKVNKVPEFAGVGPGTGRTNIPEVGGQLKMEGIATFEQLLYVFLAGIDGSITGVRDGSGPYVYTFPFFTTAAKTPKTYTIEGGDNQQEEQMLGCFVEEFELSGGFNDPVKLMANWRGQQVTPGTFTTALSPTAVYDMNANLCKLYIEAENGTIGATVKADTLTDFKLSVKTGFQVLPAFNGYIYYTSVKQVAPVIKLQATFEHNSIATAMKANWRSQTGNLVRLLWEGAAAAVAGATYSKRTLIFDAAMKWLDVDEIKMKNGNNQVTFTAEAYMATAPTPDLFAQFILVNDLSAPV